MSDTTVKKVEADTSPQGDMGQRYLASGKSVSMRLWIQEATDRQKDPSTRDYETVGFVISRKAKLELEGQTIDLSPGDSWLVPERASHRYTILEHFHCGRGDVASSRGPWARRTISATLETFCRHRRATNPPQSKKKAFQG